MSETAIASIARRARELRSVLSLEEKELSDRTSEDGKEGLSLSSWQRLVRDNGGAPNVRTLLPLHETFGVNLGWLITGHGSMFIEQEAPQKLKSVVDSEVLERAFMAASASIQKFGLVLEPAAHYKLLLRAIPLATAGKSAEELGAECDGWCSIVSDVMPKTQSLPGLSEEEARIVAAFRAADPVGKKSIAGVADAERDNIRNGAPPTPGRRAA